MNLNDPFLEACVSGMGNMGILEKTVFSAILKQTDGGNYDRAVAEADRRTTKMMKAISAGKIEVGVTYGNPDLTPVNPIGFEGMVLDLQWDEALDYVRRFTTFSHWLQDIHLGDYCQFMRHIYGLSKEEVEKKLDMRESMMKWSAIFHVVNGARRFHGTWNWKDEGEGYIRILQTILDLGGRVDSQDVGGYSPLNYTLRNEGKDNKVLLEMARMLLEKGADPNHKNRFGFVPLFACLNSMGEESAKLLLEFGADPTIEVGPGVSPMACSINYPRVEKILNTFFKKEVKKTRKTAKESGELKKCEGCGNSAGKRCTGCYMAWYCSGDCLKSDWANHKESCLARRKEYLKVKDTFKSWSGSKASSYQVVRIKISYCNEMLHINDKAKSICGTVFKEEEPTGAAGPILYNTIRTKGFKGSHGHFSSILKKGVLYVHPAILPPETW